MAALAIFALTYFFLAGFKLRWPKLDRPGAALAGSAAMVAFGVVAPEKVPAAIDFDTIILLLGMMVLSAYLTRAGFFRNTAFWVIHYTHTPRMLLIALAVVSGVLSAFLVNDTVCLLLTPMVLGLCASAGLPPTPYLLTLCMASNAGSVATFTGNPQNMLIGNLSGQSYAAFAGYMLLPALVSMAVVVAVILWAYRKQLPVKRFDPQTAVPAVDRRLLFLTLFTFAAVVIAFFAGLPMAWSALVGAAFVIVVSGKEPRAQLEKVDWMLLCFFAALFVVVQGMREAGHAQAIREAFAPLMRGDPGRELIGFSALTLVGSNLFSNVPFVMLAKGWVPTMAEPARAWQVLALASTLAGNLTLIGSVANLIVFEGARGTVDVSFFEYLKVGVPATLISLALALAVLAAEHAVLG